MLINREREKTFLQQKARSDRAELLIIYGRRRVGKTFLLKNVYGDAVFFTADLSGSFAIMNRFLQQIKPVLGLPKNLKINTWDEFFHFLSMAIKDGKFSIVVFDEFQYIPIKDEAFISILQRWWDEVFSNYNVKFVLCGSYIGLIEKVALDYNSPIYGRRTAQLEIEPLSFFDAIDFLNFKEPADFVHAYAVAGGIPLYLKEFSQFPDFETALKEKVLLPGQFLLEEGRFLTIEEFKKEPSTYFSILQAIANGKTTPNEIANECRMDTSAIGTYLSKLVELKLVRNEHSFGMKINKKKSRYYIDDEYLRFYFRYLHFDKELVYQGDSEILFKEIMTSLPEFTSQTFEKIARQYLMRNYRVAKVGRWWEKDQEIDVVGYDPDGEVLYIGECKWTNKKVDGRVLNELKSKVPSLLKDSEIFPKKMIYVLFSKSGFEGLEENDETKLVSIKDLLAYRNSPWSCSHPL